MTVHMVRVLCEPPRGEAENAIKNWVSNYNEWEQDPVTHSLTETNTRLDGSGVSYVRGDWRFLQDGEQPESMLEDLSTRLQSLQGALWHRLGYHACEHDSDSPGACEWEQTLKHGNVPSEVSL